MLRLRNLSAGVRRAALLSALGLSILSLTTLAGHTTPHGTTKKQHEPSTDLPCMLSPKAKGVIVLFSGKPEELAANFTHHDGSAPTWKIMDGGSMLTMKGDIITKQEFEDIQLHVEFKVPYMPDAKGQGRGNSGVIIQGCYEMQILDSLGKEVPGKGDCGAVYNTAAPLVNACKAPKEWQSYDIIFRAPRFDADGKNKLENARITAFLNGTLVQNNVEVPGSTGLKKRSDYNKPGPLLLQFHGNAVEFRNVWVLPLPLKGSDKYE